MARPRSHAPTVPILLAAWTSETRLKSCHALEFFCLHAFNVVVIGFCSHRTMAPQTDKQQVANLPIQVPPKEHFSLHDIHLTSIEYRGMAWYAIPYGLEGRLPTNCSHGL
jgi:hypothetical protein